MIFFEGDARQDIIDVLERPPIIFPRYLTRNNAKHAPRWELESIVHKEDPYTTKELNGLIHSFNQKSVEYDLE